MKSSALHIAAIILLGIVAFGIGIGKRDLWAPDEPRFGQVAREMIQRGDPFVLHVNGEPYSDKPPLHIWITVATTLLRGEDGKDISSFATRLPSVLGGLIGLLATYGIALILFRSTRTAFLSTIALATTLMYSWQAGRAQLDMLMAGWAIVAVLAWLLAERAETRPRRIGAWAAFWVAAALGTLSKGPPAVIVPLGAIGFYLMSRRDLSRTWRTAIIWSVAILLLTLIAGLGLMSGTPFLILTGLTVLGLLAEVVVDWLVPLAREQRGRLILTLGWFFVGLLVFAAVVGVWFVPYRMNAPKEVSDDTLLAQTVVRYLAGDSHNNPPWFYLENIPHNLMPWTVFVFLGIWMAFRSRRWKMDERPRAFLSSWILFTVIFFSLSPGKRDQYLLPCIPAFALFVGWFFDKLLGAKELRERPGWRRAAWVNIVVSLLFCVMALGMAAMKARYAQNPPAWLLEKVQDWDIVQTIVIWPMGVLGALSAVAIWWEARRRDPASVFAIVALTFMALGFYVNNAVLPKVDERKSGRNLSTEIARYRTDEPVGIYNFFREDYIVYANYFLHVIPEVGEDQPVKDTDLWKFINPERGRVFLVFRKKHYEELMEKHREFGRWLRVLEEVGVGHRDMIVTDNQGNGGQ